MIRYVNQSFVVPLKILSWVKALEARKSAGSNGINNELYKHAPKSFLHKFLNFLNVCWIYGDMPEEWRTATFIAIYKKMRQK